MTDENVSSVTFFGQRNNRRLLRKMDSNPQFSAVTSLPKLAKTNLLRRFLTKRFRREC
jgi:ADP-heptose:LPS heptosyltransferase